MNNLYNTAFVRINISVRKIMEVKNEKYLKWIKILLLFCNHKKVNCGRFTCVRTLLWKINFFLSLIITPDFFFFIYFSVTAIYMNCVNDVASYCISISKISSQDFTFRYIDDIRQDIQDLMKRIGCQYSSKFYNSISTTFFS